jgi:hypothetical protein
MRTVLPLRAGLLSIVAACSGGGVVPDALVSVDDPLVGVWRQQQAPEDDPADLQTVTFNADLTFTRQRAGDPGVQSGTYLVSGTQLTLNATFGGETEVLVGGFAVVDDELVLNAVLPTTAPTGLIGTWHGDFAIDADTQTLDLDVRADGTIHYVETRGTTVDDRTGTWQDVDGELVTRFPITKGTEIETRFRYIANHAIGEWLYAREP